VSGNTVGKAVAQQDGNQGLQDLILKYQDDYAKVLPQHVDAAHWVRLAQGLLRRNQDLARVAAGNPGSFMSALLECARLGHEPGTENFALVAFGNEVTGIEQYQGEIERMYRAGAVQTVIAEVVRKNDYFHWQPGQPPQHDADWFATAEARGELVGVYAYAVLNGGGISKVVVMGREEVAKHREVARTDVMWRKWPEAMYRKTAIHELEKWVPTSSEFQRERLRALAEADTIRQQATFARVDSAEVQRPTNVDDDGVIVEGEVE
jgi:recombination protein RecT